METIDNEIAEGSMEYLERAAKSDKPFLLWVNFTRMHVCTRLKAESEASEWLNIWMSDPVKVRSPRRRSPSRASC